MNVKIEAPTWDEASDAEKGALLLAQHRGETVQVLCYAWGSEEWQDKISADWHGHMRYRTLSRAALEPSPEVAALVEALKRIEEGWIGEADPGTGELIQVNLSEDEMQDIALAALAAYRASIGEKE